jgi:branched-subunit amino acid transport protein
MKLSDVWAVIIGTAMIAFILASYPLKWEIPTLVQVIVIILGGLIAFMPRIDRVLEGRTVRLPGGVEINDHDKAAE